MDVDTAVNAVQQGDNLLLQLGVGGIFAFIIIKEVLAFVSKRNGDDTASNSSMSDVFVLLRNIEDKVKDLHSWHDAKDEDQVFVWYVRKSLERQIERLCRAVEQMGKASSGQTDAVEEVLNAIVDEMKELKQRLPKQGGHAGG